jgi:uncharacterized protein (TIGR03435 family)
MPYPAWPALAGLILLTVVLGQAQEKLTFEVASVRRSADDSDRVSLGIQPGGRFTAVNVPVSMLVRTAYRIRDFQMIGAPDWLSTERYDVIAKADSDFAAPSPGETISRLELMLQSLLGERFKLIVRRETRELPIFVLVLTRPEGKLGQDLRPTTGDCEPFRRGQDVSAKGTCGVRMTSGQLVGRNVPLSELTEAVSPTLERIVIDWLRRSKTRPVRRSESEPPEGGSFYAFGDTAT